MERFNEQDQKPLNMQDLQLLLDSYKNTVELNTILVSQQKTLLEQHDQLITKQKEVCKIIGDCLDNVKNHAHELGNIKNLIEKSEEINTVKLSSEHKHMNARIYGLGAGLVVIILSLITFVSKATEKLEILDNIARFLGV